MASKITMGLNRLSDPAATQSLQCELHQAGADGQTAIYRLQESKAKAQRCTTLYNEHKTSTANQWKKVTWLDESSTSLFPTKAHVWRKFKNSFSISWEELSPMIALHGCIRAKEDEAVWLQHLLHILRWYCFGRVLNESRNGSLNKKPALTSPITIHT